MDPITPPIALQSHRTSAPPIHAPTAPPPSTHPCANLRLRSPRPQPAPHLAATHAMRPSTRRTPAFLPPAPTPTPHRRCTMPPCRPTLPLLFKRPRPRRHTRPGTATLSTTPPPSTPAPQPHPTPTPTTSPPPPPPCLVYTFPHKPVPYTEAWALQTRLVQQRRHNPSLPDTLLLLQHEPVYTLGTASSLSHVLFDTPIRHPNDSSPPPPTPALVRTERGGEVTYHGPGQLVVYPILNLRRHRKDLHWYLRTLEQVVINTLWSGYRVRAGRKQGLTGVWVGDEKICAMGLKVSRWVTMHGLALNVCMDLRPFQRIVPCGVSEFGVVSLHQVVARGGEGGDGGRGGVGVGVDEVGRVLVREFCEAFGPYAVVHAEGVLDL